MYYTVLFESSAACTEFKRQEIVAFLCIPWLEAKYVRKQRQAWSEQAGDAMGWDAMGCNQVLGGLGLEASLRRFAPPCWSLWIHVRFLQSSLIMNWWSLILHGLFHLCSQTHWIHWPVAVHFDRFRAVACMNTGLPPSKIHLFWI